MRVSSPLPLGILCLYFVHSFLFTFPMTAYGDWLFNTLHMSPATTSMYYSLSFFPWNLKPIYSLLSDNVPIFGYRRKYYIIICEVIASICVLCTGLFVSTISWAFVIRFIDSSCEAFSQMMLGIVLVDVASGDQFLSAKVQSWANAAKNSASILALLIGIPIYKARTITSKQIISWSSLIPLLGVAVCFFILEEKKVRHTSKVVEQQLHRTSRALLTQKWQSLVATVNRIVTEQKKYTPVMVFFFLSSALPHGGSAWYQYTYSLLSDQKECFQYMSLAGMFGSVISCAMYGTLCSGRNVRGVFAASIILSMIAGLPQWLLAPPMKPLPLPICTFMTIESFITSFTGEFALLQLLVVATYFCPAKKELHGLTYSLYLSFMDFGGVVSSFLSTILIELLGITKNPVTHLIDWTHLWILILIGCVFKIAILGFLYLLPVTVDQNDQEDSAIPLLSDYSEETVISDQDNTD